MSTKIGDVIPREAAANRIPAEPNLLRTPDFGVDASLIRVRTIDLTNAALDTELRGMAANWLWVLNATSLTAEMTINFDYGQGQGITISKGFFMSGVRFNKMIVTHAAQAGQTLTLLYALLPNVTLRTVNPSSAASAVSVEKPTVIDTTADVTLVSVTATEILAADSRRRHAILTNLVTNTATFRIGDAAVTATRGTPLGPGETLILEGTEAIFGFKIGAGNETIAVTAVED